jgi:hypothetical protein
MTLQQELNDLQIVAREMNRILDLHMTDESLNWPQLEEDDEEDFYDSYDALGEEADRDEIR